MVNTGLGEEIKALGQARLNAGQANRALLLRKLMLGC